MSSQPETSPESPEGPPATKTSGRTREGGRYKAPALDKGLDILELLAEQKDGLSRKEIAERLGRSIHELFRMIVCLEERGYIAQDSRNDNIVLSRKLFELGLRHPPNERLIEAAEPILYELSQAIQQGCHITVPSHNSMLVVAKQDSAAKLSLTVRVGMTVPLHNSVSGIVFLAFQPEDRLADMLARSGAEQADIDHASASIAQTRRHGYLIQQSRIAQGVTEIAVPIFGHTGRVVATLAIPVLSISGERPKPDEIALAARRAAERISRAIGGVPAAPEDAP